MEPIPYIIAAYLAAVNLMAFILCVADKWKAKRDRWRIPEATLLGLAALGGSVGLLIGMFAFRHKIRKPAFYLGVPAMLAAQLAVAWWLLK